MGGASAASGSVPPRPRDPYRLLRQVDPDQRVPTSLCERRHQAGLADAGRALEQHGPLQLQGPEEPLGVHRRGARCNGVV